MVNYYVHNSPPPDTIPSQRNPTHISHPTSLRFILILPYNSLACFQVVCSHCVFYLFLISTYLLHALSIPSAPTHHVHTITNDETKSFLFIPPCGMTLSTNSCVHCVLCPWLLLNGLWIQRRRKCEKKGS